MQGCGSLAGQVSKNAARASLLGGMHVISLSHQEAWCGLSIP